MKTCEVMTTALVELVFGELDPETELRLNRHLETCAACREEERGLLGLRHAVAGPETRPPETLRERIRASLPGWRAGRRLGFLWRPAPACAAVAVCLVGVLLVLVLPRGDRPAAGPDDLAARSRRAPVSAVAPPFVPAGPFDTGLVVAVPRESLADSSTPGPASGGDSL